MKSIQSIILAAGKGTRLNAKHTPKALYPILNKPMIEYSVESLKKAGFDRPIVVIGFKGEKIKQVLKNKVEYVWQRRQLGTGHALLKAKDKLKGKKSILVILGDMPFWKPETFKQLIKSHQQSGATLSLVSIIFKNPSFFQYGRIKRDKKGNILKIIEERQATRKEKEIKECNPSCYLIEADWLWKNLPKVKKSDSGEYYLTDIIELAVAQNKKVNTLTIQDWKQAFGINTREHLEMAEKIAKKEQLEEP